MTIIEKKKVIAAYERAIFELKAATHEEACASVAQALSLSAELVDAAITEDDAEVES